MTTTITLPWAPSANTYYRYVGHSPLISRAGRTFRAKVCALMAARNGNGPRKPPMGGRIALCMDAFPPDRRKRRDIDNLQKPTLDALQHAGAYEDDCLVDLLITRRREVVCIDWLGKYYPDRHVPRSACIGCPYHRQMKLAVQF